MELRKEKSCGCIIIENNKVLLIQEKNGKHWSFPKGHMEENETEVQTALREVKEEVSLDVDIDIHKRYEISYVINDEIDKTVVFFVAKPKSTEFAVQETEIESAKWCDFKEALNTITYKECKDFFEKVIEDLGL